MDIASRFFSIIKLFFIKKNLITIFSILGQMALLYSVSFIENKELAINILKIQFFFNIGLSSDFGISKIIRGFFFQNREMKSEKKTPTLIFGVLLIMLFVNVLAIFFKLQLQLIFIYGIISIMLFSVFDGLGSTHIQYLFKFLFSISIGIGFFFVLLSELNWLNNIVLSFLSSLLLLYILKINLSKDFFSHLKKNLKQDFFFSMILSAFQLLIIFLDRILLYAIPEFNKLNSLVFFEWYWRVSSIGGVLTAFLFSINNPAKFVKENLLNFKATFLLTFFYLIILSIIYYSVKLDIELYLLFIVSVSCASFTLNGVLTPFYYSRSMPLLTRLYAITFFLSLFISIIIYFVFKNLILALVIFQLISALILHYTLKNKFEHILENQ